MIRWECICGNDPCNGLDCGVVEERKKPAPKSQEEMAAIRAKAKEDAR